MKSRLYRGEHLNRVAFPLGGLGAGMVCLEGTGALSHVSLRHKPAVHHEPMMFAALHVTGAGTARVIEGPVPRWKTLGGVAIDPWQEPGNGLRGRTYGLPRFARAAFTAQFPFGTVTLEDDAMPVRVELTGWSPFTPGAEDDSSLPVAALEYRLSNRTKQSLEAVFSFHSSNFMRRGEGAFVAARRGGVVLSQPPLADKPWEEGHFAAFTTERAARVDCAWFRGGWFDPLTMLWRTVAAGETPARAPHPEGKPGSGGSIYVPFRLAARGEKTIKILLAWYVPNSDVRAGTDCAFHRPWYAGRFDSITAVAEHWQRHYARLRQASATFRDCFYDTTLPAEVVEAAAANLAILKSPTVLRQMDGRVWAWEGCSDGCGCCSGSCTHVWNYAQALPHLFPALERTLRETEFRVSQDGRGHQNFRTPLPICEPDHKFHAAADGQLGGLMKLHRDWRISGDTDWLRSLWPAARRSLDYCIATWDPDHTGTLVEPHHNTYDIEFWGADAMCTSFYLGALTAAVAMGQACGDDVSLYERLLADGRRAVETTLWNGEHFIQRIQWTGLRAGDPFRTASLGTDYTPEARAILEREGPKYQYGNGCLSDGILGDWMARCCALPGVADERRVARHLASVFLHNFHPNLRDHANPQRPGYAFGREGGLVVCSWPRGDKPSLPFPYSDEVWTGCEYAAAAHLMMLGRVREGLKIVKTARARYDGRYRNPFNEYECGHWYARAMSSYSLLQALTGVNYDAVTKELRFSPRIKGDWKAFLATATGYGTVGIRNGRPYCRVRHGRIVSRRSGKQG